MTIPSGSLPVMCAMPAVPLAGANALQASDVAAFTSSRSEAWTGHSSAGGTANLLQAGSSLAVRFLVGNTDDVSGVCRRVRDAYGRPPALHRRTFSAHA